MTALNEHGQPVGRPLGSWSAPSPLFPVDLPGAYMNLEPLSEAHSEELHHAFAGASDSLWTYMSIGPFGSAEDLSAAIATMRASPGWVPYAISVEGVVRGFASYLRMDPPTGVVEIGSIVFAPALQRTVAATEALYRMIDHAFTSGYRRCEWKCDDLNQPSRRAADRLGFSYEGTFRNATHYKGRNRDTAWYAIVDHEWPSIRAVFEAWLDPVNFGPDGGQVTSLSELMAKRRTA